MWMTLTQRASAGGREKKKITLFFGPGGIVDIQPDGDERMPGTRLYRASEQRCITVVESAYQIRMTLKSFIFPESQEADDDTQKESGQHP